MFEFGVRTCTITLISRHRPLSLLASVVLAQVLLLAFQIKREHDVRLVRYWAVKLCTPRRARRNLVILEDRRHVDAATSACTTRARENERLQTELDELRMRNRELESQAAEGQRLASLLNFRNAHPEAPMLAAQVIGASADPTSHTLFINRGERDHVRHNHGRDHARRSRRQNRRSVSHPRRRCC